MYIEARKSTVTPTASGDTFTVAGNETTGALYTEVKNSTVRTTVSVTRPNDTAAYTAGDIIGTATGSTAAITISSIGSINKIIRITDTKFYVSTGTLPSGMTSFRLHLYNATPPSAYGDNTAWDLPSGDRSSYLGYVDLGTPVDVGSTLYVQQTGLTYSFRMGSTASLYGYLVTNGAFTPSAQTVKTFTLYAMPI
jgi:hypothetical protein